jgi:superfamily II DNA or RNA helicase
LLAERILETYAPLQSANDRVDPSLATLLRKPLPAQAVAITATAKYLRQVKAARIVAECGPGKTYMALGAIHALSAAEPSTTLVMCPSHITHNPAQIWPNHVVAIFPVHTR